MTEKQNQSVSAQCKFDGFGTRQECTIEHHDLVQSEPEKWPKYQTRLLYAHPVDDKQKQWSSLTKEERGEFVQRICNTGTMFVTPLLSIINEIEWLIWERNK